MVEPGLSPESDSRVSSGARVYWSGWCLLSATLAAPLWSHTKDGGDVLGRYSWLFFAVLVAHALATVTLGAMLLAAPRPLRALTRLTSRARRGVQRLGGKGMALGLGHLGIWVLAVAAALALESSSWARSVGLHAALLGAALWLSIGWIALTRTQPRERLRAYLKFGVCCAFGAIALLGLEAVLRRNLGRLPPGLVFTLPHRGSSFFPFYEFDEEIRVGYRYKPGIRLHQALRRSDATIYGENKKLVRPVPPEEDRVLTEAEFVTDENGYRNSSPLLDHYELVASGDSFTSYSVEPRPWPTILGERLSKPVLNLGLQGYGPQSAAESVALFGLPRRPKVVVITWYEGNELLDAQAYEKKRRSGLAWQEAELREVPLLKRWITYHALRYGLLNLSSAQAAEDEDLPAEYPYPFELHLEAGSVELAFSPTYVSLLALSKEEVDRVIALEDSARAYARLKASLEAQGGKLLVAYVPTKSHAYAPHVPVELLATKLGGARKAEVSEDGVLRASPEDGELVTVEGLLESLDGQRDAVMERLRSLDIDVLDLTPTLQEHAKRGEQLYWVRDNHWNPEGHRVAAEAIAERLRAEL